MASQTKNNGLSINLPKCDNCNSTDITETSQGYVCRTCGVVQEMQKLEYNHPYEEIKVQNAPMKYRISTSMGLKYERLRLANSPKMIRLNKLNNIMQHEDMVYKTAENEVSRLLDAMGYTNFKKKQDILNTIKNTWTKLPKGTKFRNVEKLTPVVLYVCFKTYSLSINILTLLEISKIEKREFYSCLLEVCRLKEDYSKRNKKIYVSRKIMEITEKFGLGMEFYHKANDLMKHLFIIVNSTKDDVMAGLACSMIALNSEYRDIIKVNEICTEIGIEMSTIQGQIKRNLIEKYNISGFTSLVQSADLLEKIVKKLTGIKASPEEEKAIVHGEKKLKNNVLKIIKKVIQVKPDSTKIAPKNEIDDIVMVEDASSGKVSFSVLTEKGIVELIYQEKEKDKVIINDIAPPFECFNIHLHVLTKFEGKGPPGPPLSYTYR